MEYVVLTSQKHLIPEQDPGKINALLRAAAAVALKMPKFKTMELWNCRRGHACIFRYDAADAPSERFCRLTWRSTWGQARDPVIRSDIFKAWEKVAVTNVSSTFSHVPDMAPIRFERCPLPSKYYAFGYSGYGDILEFLKLLPYALQPTSAMQARAEAVPTREKMWWYSV
jgi:hypothetical protein